MDDLHGRNEKDIFAEALEKDPGEREAYLDEACGSDQGLRARIRKLFNAHEAATGFLDEPFGGVSPAGMERISRFRILRELGRGGQGTVFLAEDEKLHRQVALKVLPSGFDLSSHLLERFKREAEAASRLDHPGICSVFETGEQDGHHYIVMRYVEGESLAKKIANAREDSSRFKGGVFETTQPGKSGSGNDSTGTGSSTSRQDAVMRSVYCIEKAALAVHAAHEAGIVHRDIKPGNILVTPDDDPVILDFGLARLEESDGFSLTRSTDLLGTPSYMSPEQIRGDRKRVDRQTDIYSLAATLTECLTLRPPFEAPTREGLYRAILTEETPDPRTLNPKVPPDLGVILQTAMAKSPEHRYKTALDFAEELRRVRQHEPILTRRAGPGLRLWRWSQRNPRLAAALGGIILVLVIGIAVSTYLLGVTSATLNEVSWLSDIRLLPFLENSAENELWPAKSQKVQEMKRWLSEAEGLYNRLEYHQRTLDDLKSANDSDPDPMKQLDMERQKTFIDKLSGFNTRIDVIRKRMEFASTVEDRTLTEHRDKWEKTIAAIANKDINPNYKGLKLEPIIGLIPIGQDPDSKLYEFAHLQTGKIPSRDKKTHCLKITEEIGLVFVLIPGGSFKMGALPQSKEHPGSDPHVDPLTNGNEFPLNKVTLDPFFLSKYEMTQGQWLRITGENPSLYCPGSIHTYYPTGADLSNPVEMVSWSDCDEVMRRLDLALPREAQWEYACRAGTTTPWYTGQESITLKGYENIADRGAKKGFAKGTPLEDGFIDGCIATAPVGSFHSNPFGLHDMLGNVTEWCRDRYGEYIEPVINGDGKRTVYHFLEASKAFIHRGGNFRTVGRAAMRGGRLPNWASEQYGLRPALSIDKNSQFEDYEKSIPPGQEEALQALCDEADRFAFNRNYQEAEPLYRKLIVEYSRYLENGHWRTFYFRMGLAWVLFRQNKYPEAEPIYRQIVEDLSDSLGDKHPKTLRYRDILARTLDNQVKDVEAEQLFYQVYEGTLPWYGENHAFIYKVMQDLARIIMRQGKCIQAEQIFRQLLETQIHELGEDHPDTIRSRELLGWTLIRLGAYEEAEQLYRQNLEIGKSLIDDEDLRIQDAMENLANSLMWQGRLSEAKSLIERLVEIRIRTLGEEHKYTLNARSIMADILRRQGKPAEAETMHTEVLDTMGRVAPNRRRRIAYNMKSLALALVELERFSEAETLFKEAIRLTAEIFPEESLIKIPYHKDYGEFLLALKRYDEAEEQLVRAYKAFITTLEVEHAFTQDTLELLVKLYDVWDKPEKAARYRAMLVEEISGSSSTTTENQYTR